MSSAVIKEYRAIGKGKLKQDVRSFEESKLPLPEHQKQQTFEFDTAEHDFRSMLVDIFKYSELGTLLTTSIKANASAAAVDSGDGGGGGGSSGGGGSGTSESEKVHSMQPTVPKEVDGMARALSNLHRVIKYAESDEWSVQRNPQAAANALTAKVGAAANKEDAEQPADTDQQHQSKRQKQQLPSEDAQQHGDGGSGVGGGSGGDQTSKKKRFIPEPARKNGPNSKRRKKSNATPFHAAYAQITRPNCAKHGTPEQLVLHNRFNKMLRHYVRMVAAPLLGVGPDDVIYQRNPTLRISQPSDIAMGHIHTDYDYHHQPSEVNFWIPVTKVFGANTLFVESTPGAGDYAPCEMDWGYALRFWGNQVRHHTVANMTDASRVSIDFRAVARPRFDAAFVDSRGRPTVFRVGEYYADSKDPFVPAVYIGDATAGGGAATAAGAACNSGGSGAATGASGGNSCGGGSAAAAAAS